MNKALSFILFFVLFGCFNSSGFAAELLDVKPVVSGDSVSVEISSDIAMTYTYYKVPGQARAIVDIAEADPEKVEPLIVVNKGVVSSISVDKAEISGIVVSRIIFNLVSESDISVTASADRKLLMVTFGDAAMSPKTELKSEPKPVQHAEPVAKEEKPSIAAIPPAGDGKEEDPLGLDEPTAKSAAAVPPVPAPVPVPVPAAVIAAPVAVAPSIMRVPKLEPVVPIAAVPAQRSPLSIKGIAAGESYIEIRANQPIDEYKTTRISKPERLIIDIAAAKVNQKPKTISINKFGITKARIGVSPDNIRIVIDSNKASFPGHTLSTTEDGLRINFK